MDAVGSSAAVTAQAHPPSPGRWLIAAAALWVALVCWAVASPALSSPDENVHLALIACQAGVAECDRPQEVRDYPCFAFRPDVTADCAPDEATLSTAGVEAGRYPGLYAAVLRPLVTESVEGSVLRIRLFNATLAVVVMLLSLKASLRRLRPAVGLSFTVGLMPLGMFLIPSVNPSGWAIVGAAALWGPLLTMTLDGLRWVRVAAAAVAFAMLVGSRNEGWVIAASIGVAAMLFGWPWSRRWVPALVVLGASALIAVARTNPGLESTASVGGRGPWEHLLMALTTPGDAFGATALFPAPLGWLDTPLPAVVGLLALGSAAAVVLLGVGVMDSTKGRAIIVFMVMTAAQIVAGWAALFPSALQPRMALPLIIVAVGLCLLPAGRSMVVLTATQAALLAAALSMANSLALLGLTLRFTVAPAVETTIEPSPDYPSPLDLLAAGQPSWALTAVTPFLAWLVASLAFTGYLLVLLGRGGLREGSCGGRIHQESH